MPENGQQKLYAAEVEWQKGGSKYWLSSTFTVRVSNATAAIELSHK